MNLRQRRNREVLRRYNAVENILRLVGLRDLAPGATHMFYPNDPSRSAGNRHYIYKRNVGWTADGVSLTRTEPKYDVIGGVLETIPAGQLGRNGRIEPSSINIATHSANLSTEWGPDIGSLVYTNNTTYTTIDYTGGTDDYSLSSITEDLGGRSFTFSCEVRGIVGQTVNICVDYAGSPAAYGKETTVTLTGSWQRVSVSFTFGAVGSQNLFARVGNRVLHDGSAANVTVCDVRNAQLEEKAYATSYIPNVTGTSTRSADAWSYSDAGLANVKSMLWIGTLGHTTGVDLTTTRIAGCAIAGDGAAANSLWLDDQGGHCRCVVGGGGDYTVGSYDPAVTAGTAFSMCVARNGDCVNGVYNSRSLRVPAGMDRLGVAELNDTHQEKASGVVTYALLAFDVDLSQAQQEALTTTLKNAIASGL